MILKNWYILIVIAIIQFSIINCKQYKVKVRDGSPLQIRTNSQTILPLPVGNLSSIYNTNIKVLKQTLQKQVPSCQQLPVQITFNQTFYYELNRTQKAPPIIYNFEDIKFLKYVLDAIEYQGRIWIAYENGQINVIKHIIQNQKNPYIQHQFSFIFSKTKLQAGYFLIMKDKLYFVNAQFVFYINATKQQQKVYFAQLKTQDDFKTVIPIQGPYFAIAYQSQGIYIFKENLLFSGQAQHPENSFGVQQTAVIRTLPDPTKLGQSKILNVQDLFYDHTTERLYILDRFKGVYFSKLQITDDQISPQEPKLVIPEKYCTLFKNYSNSIFMSCQKGIVQLVLDQSRTSVESSKIVMNHPQITVQQMFVYSKQTEEYITAPIVFFVGSHAFRAYYMNSTVQYNENHELDKLIILNNTFVAISQNWIKTGFYNVVQHQIKCNFRQNNEFIGSNLARITAQAQCRSDLINDKLLIFKKTDTCIYQQDFKLVVWQPDYVRFQYIGIFVVLSWVCVGLAMLICCFHQAYLYLIQKAIEKKYNLNRLNEQK